jgi:mercuric ion transport protein
MPETGKTCRRCKKAPARVRPRQRLRGSLHALASFPAALLPLLPSAACPACIAAYAGVLSALGMGFLAREDVLLPLIGLSLVLGLASIAWTVRAHGRRSPLALAVVAALLIAGGRLAWSAPVAVYAGAAAFLIAAGWNLWLRVRSRVEERPA